MTEITKENLIKAGWTLTDTPETIPIEKVIGMPTNDDELTPIALEVNTFNNQEQFALRLPDGARLDLLFTSMESIELFEATVMGWQPVY